MTSYLYERKVQIFDYPRFAEPFRDQLRQNAERLVAEAGIEIEFLRKRTFRKKDRVKEVLARRGEHPGLVWVLSAMEPCSTYKPWHDKQTDRTFLKPDDGKCLHYYFYSIDEVLGLCYVRVPTWLPCRLQVYFNGHNWLAVRLRRRRSITRCWTMPSPVFPTGSGRSGSPTICASFPIRSPRATWSLPDGRKTAPPEPRRNSGPGLVRVLPAQKRGDGGELVGGGDPA